MNSTQGAWGIQDRHDRVISWLSAIVVTLLVLYALIFFTKQVMPSGPAGAGPVPPTAAPTPTPATRAPTPPVTRPVPASPRPSPVHTRIARIATPRGRLPSVPASPAAAPTPQAPTRAVTRPPTPRAPTPAPTRAALPTPAPTRLPPPATRQPTPRPPTPTQVAVAPPTAPSGPVVLRVGDVFASGSDALAFAREHDIPSFKLTRATEAPDSPLFLEVGPFDSGAAALREMGALRTRLRDRSIPVVMHSEGGSSPSPVVGRPDPPPVTRRPAPATTTRPAPVATRTPPATRAPAPTRAPIPTSRPVDPSAPTRSDARAPLDPGGDDDLPPGGYTVQVASFREPDNALNFRRHLRAKGYPAHVSSVTVQGTAWYRVQIGRFDEVGPARQVADEFGQAHPDTYQIFVRRR